MRKFLLPIFAALLLTVTVSAAYAEPEDFYHEDNFGGIYLNPQPLPP
jgi:hypothetical protein